MPPEAFQRLVSIFTSLIEKLGPTQGGDDDPVNVNGTRVYIAPPRGFVEADNFCGFQHVRKQATLMITEMPAPVDQIIKGFDAPSLATRGMKLLEKNAVDVAGLDGALFHLQQKALGVMHEKWVAIFGNSHDTVMVMASFPADDREVSKLLRDAVLSVQWDPEASIDPLDSMPFAVTPPEGLRLAQHVQKMLLYTSDGKLNHRSSRDPLFVIGQSTGARCKAGDEAAQNVQEFARQRVVQTEGYYGIEIKRERPLDVDGLDAYEIDADATDVRTQDPVSLYQLIILSESDTTYFIAQGIVHRDLASQYGPVFESAAQSFRLKE